MIIQADELLPLSTVIVAPTSTAAPKRSFRPQVEIGGTRARVLVEQLGAVDRSWLGASQGVLTRLELEEVDRALAVVLGRV